MFILNIKKYLFYLNFFKSFNYCSIKFKILLFKLFKLGMGEILSMIYRGIKFFFFYELENKLLFLKYNSRIGIG